MTIRLDRIVPPEPGIEIENVFLTGEHAAYPRPAADVGGVSLPSMPTLRHIALVTTVMFTALGTASPAEANPVTFQDLRFNFPAAPMETTADHYDRLRREIVAAGIPLLGDDELRAEIEARRGDS